MSDTFASAVPFGKYFEYEVSNLTLPVDNTYFVTVVYSTQDISTPQDQYLHYWFKHHPALKQLNEYTNFSQMHIGDPAYGAYLQQALPITPAILITLPPMPGEGYVGRVVYCAYGQNLSTNPNTIARELQTVFNQAEFHQHYTQTQALQPLPPVKPNTASEGLNNSLVVVLGIAVLAAFMLTTKRRRPTQ